MVVDAIDQYLDPLTEQFGNHKYQLLRKRYVIQLGKDRQTMSSHGACIHL